MKFKAEHVDQFKMVFAESQPYIEEMKGCTGVQLMQDLNDHTILCTYSTWENELDLNAYRSTEFFKRTWSKTKALFDAKPEAWSLDIIE